MSSKLPAKRRGAGRPAKLTPRTKERILSAIRAGVPAKTACIGSGVGESTFYDWLQRAREPGARREYREFAKELAEAREAGQIQRIALIQKAGLRDWRAAAWLAERIDPENFSARYQFEYGGRVDVNFLTPLPVPKSDAKFLEVTVDVPEPPP